MPWLSHTSKSKSRWIRKQGRGLGWRFHCVVSAATREDLSLTHVCPILTQNIISEASLHVAEGHDKNNSGRSSKEVTAPWPWLLHSERKNPARVQAGASVFPSAHHTAFSSPNVCLLQLPPSHLSYSRCPLVYDVIIPLPTGFSQT